jgi:heme oxygenase (staphylobilin-producing)
VYLVTFRLDPGEYDSEFHELNDAIQAVADGMPGYLGKRTWHAAASDEVLVVYYWESLAALESFGAASVHGEAKQRWTEWYDAYEVRITEVLDAYGSGFGDDADPPA